MNYSAEIDAALSSDCTLSRSDVEKWIEASTDLSALAKLYKITGEAYYRIKPELGKDLACKAIGNYLLECIRRDIKDDDTVENRHEAAATLHGWLRKLLEAGSCDDVIRRMARSITDLFLTSGKDIRDAIETGFLEHALESIGLRPYFEFWSEDPRLREAWERALDWGKAHPDSSWNQIRELRRIMESENKA